MAVITISRQLGSGGEYIAQQVAKALDYEYVDKDILYDRATRKYGILEELVEEVDEKKPRFWHRFGIERRTTIKVISSIVYDLANSGDVVIMGRGGQVLLRDLSNAFHVKIVASLGVRISRVMDERNIEKRSALKLINESDEDRGGFIRYLFNVDWMEPELYDLTINTGKVQLDSAVELIVRAASLEEFVTTEDSQKLLQKLRVVSLVEKALADHPGIKSNIGVSSAGNSIALMGIVGSVEEKDLAEFIARKHYQGVAEIVNDLCVAELNSINGISGEYADYDSQNMPKV